MPDPPTITALIVDDEAPAREAIRLRLAEEPDVSVVGEAADGPAAIRLLHETRPDLLFLDIHMPEMDGFEVIERLHAADLPAVVFVTAYDRYALKAFETHAVDYLLKPFTANRFQSAVDRVRLELARSGGRDAHRRLLSLLEARARERAAGGTPDRLVRLTVKHEGRLVLVKASDIDWIESSANYACLHAHGASYAVRMTMTELERRLDPACFARIHRSTIVQIDRVATIAPLWHGDYTVTLSNGTVLKMSRSYRGRLRA